MKKIIFLIFIIFSNQAYSFETSAKQAILIDVLSGDVLYEKNIDQKISPASITKIMTAIVAFDLIKKGELTLNEKFKISKNAWRMSSEGYSSMFIMPNDKVSVENLLKGIIIVSGNDACVALAEGIAGTEEEFVNMMNQMAEKIDLKNTRFANSSGLYDGNNYSTVEDISKMSVYLINNFPEFYKYYSEKKFTWDRTGGAPITQGNRNPILYKNIGGDGIKTGYLDNSGYSLAASIKENERRLLSVISGTKSKNERSRESVRILSYGKNRYDLIKIPKISENYKFKTWNIKQKIINAEMRNDIYLTVPSRQKNKIRIEIEDFKNPISKNVKKGENLATINVYFEDNLIKSSKLLSTINTNKENFFVRFLNSFSHFVWG
jgi:D-alanyl-D-alanine carboxypeptidase (penicillin-binding protein 5/6)